MEQNNKSDELGCSVAAFIIVWLALLAGLYFISQSRDYNEDKNYQTIEDPGPSL